MKKFYSLFLCVFFIAVIEAIPIQSLSTIANQLKTSEKDTWIIFDVDDVLITTKDSFAHPECDSIFYGLIGQEFAKAKTDEEKENLMNHLSLLEILSNVVSQASERILI